MDCIFKPVGILYVRAILKSCVVVGTHRPACSMHSPWLDFNELSRYFPIIMRS